VRAELLGDHAPELRLSGKDADLIAAGEIHVELAETVPLEQVARAHELSESGYTRGKIVLTVTG